MSPTPRPDRKTQPSSTTYARGPRNPGADRWIRAWAIGLGLALLVPLGTLGAQGVPAQLEAELKLWLEAAQAADPAGIARRMPKTNTILIKMEGYPDGPKELRLDTHELRRKLEVGQADRLGLDAGLLLPRPRHLKWIKRGRWSATDERCPEVRWVFTFQGARWRLAEIHRQLLGC